MSNKSPLISVILPVYNAEPYLKEAIESILSQSLGDFELILINDGSDDDSGKIIDKFSDLRIVKISHSKNIGLIKTLNEGIKLSKGEFIARMDADDISLPTRFEKQLRLLVNKPEIGICSTWYKTLDKKVNFKKGETDPDLIKCELLFSCPIAHPAVMIRKKVMEYYSEDFPHAEDYELWTRLSEKVKITNYPEVLLVYRRTPQQVSAKYNRHQRNSMLKAQGKLLEKTGINLIDLNKQINDQIFFREFNISIDFIQQAENYLKSILDANKNTHFFRQESLEYVVLKLWFMICTHIAGYGLRTQNIFYKSGLFKPNLLTKSSTIKFALKNLMGKK